MYSKIVNLAYGQTGYALELCKNHNVDIIEPELINPVHNQSFSIVEAIRNPYKSKSLKELVGNNDTVAIIFSDITRPTPYHIILPILLKEIQYIPKKNIYFFCANGTHRKATDQELIEILGEFIVKNYKIIQNSAYKPELYEYVGKTSSGLEVFLRKEILRCKIKILTGFIEPHFFAGFSGGGKALMPGMAFIKTIKNNHSITHLSNKNAKCGVTEGNPIWQEIMESAELVPGLFLLNITLNKYKKITNVFAGDLRTAHLAGCKFIKDSAMVPVDKLYDIVITSNSGYPLDLNIYQTVKGMSTAAQIVKVDGKIILVAECRNGIPPNSDYEKVLTSMNSINELLEYIKENESKLNDTWQIYIQALIQQKATVYLFSDKLDNNTIRKSLLYPVKDIKSLLNDLVKEIGSQARICVLPEGPQTIPYLKPM